MKAASVRELKEELAKYPPKQLVELCLRLAKFKKENKELLTYLLYEASDEAAYIQSVKQEIDTQFDNINRRSFYFIKKSIRKILREIKKYVRYSKKKETEVELLLYFCQKLRQMSPSMNRSKVLKGLYERQIGLIRKSLASLHEDLQYDYQQELEELMQNSS
ncbi:MAG: hypothetical protein AAFV95_24900 [Bacteroidota bacterium]